MAHVAPAGARRARRRLRRGLYAPSGIRGAGVVSALLVGERGTQRPDAFGELAGAAAPLVDEHVELPALFRAEVDGLRRTDRLERFHYSGRRRHMPDLAEKSLARIPGDL